MSPRKRDLEHSFLVSPNFFRDALTPSLPLNTLYPHLPARRDEKHLTREPERIRQEHVLQIELTPPDISEILRRNPIPPALESPVNTPRAESSSANPRSGRGFR